MRLFSIVLSILLFSTNSVAETEGWYFNASVGLADKKNPGSVEQVISSAENSNGTERVTACIDFGFYWPVYKESVLLGIVSNASFDSVQDTNFNEVVAHDLKYTGISAIVFLDESIGKGVFIRYDSGNASAEYRYSNNSFIVDDGSGKARLIGIGNSVPLKGNKTRVIVSLNSISVSIGNREFISNQVMMGFMW